MLNNKVTRSVAFQSLCSELGIQPGYLSSSRRWIDSSNQVRAAILHEMGYPIQSVPEVQQSLASLGSRLTADFLEPVSVLLESDPTVFIYLRPGFLRGYQVSGSITLEDGQELSIPRTKVKKLARLMRAGKRGWVVMLPLRDVPIGYHHINVTIERPNGTGYCLTSIARLIVTPNHCYLPPALASGEKLWGVDIQLPSLRSCEGLGIGDFSDLLKLVNRVAKKGAAFVGLNPLGALSLAKEADFGPYSPICRSVGNPLYLAVPWLPGYNEADIPRLLDSYAADIAKANSDQEINYPLVVRLKLPVFRAIYRWVMFESSDSRVRDRFSHYCAFKGRDLHQYAVLQARLVGGSLKDWQDPTRDEIDLWKLMSMLFDEQLAFVQSEAVRLGMPIGLYLDLPIGVGAINSESRVYPDLFEQGISAGCPSNSLGEPVQNWGLPVMNPRVLKHVGYQPVIDFLRFNMKSAGALRADHVRWMSSLFWVPEGMNDGAYVKYPLTDLMRIVALESVRNKCMVIGEALGVVPPELEEVMSTYGVFTYRLVMFEQDGNRFKEPETYPVHALTAFTTHDLPTLLGYVGGVDIVHRDQAGLIRSDEERQLMQVDRQKCLTMLGKALGLSFDLKLPGSGISVGPLPEVGLAPQLNLFMQATGLTLEQVNELQIKLASFLGQTASQLVAVRLEDLLCCLEQFNLPGTVYPTYPNWRKVYPPSVDNPGSMADRIMDALKNARMS